MQLETAELQRLLWNALLFTDKKSPAGGVARFTVSYGALTVEASDGHVGYSEVVTVDPQSHTPGVYFQSIAQMKETLAFTKEYDAKLVSLNLGQGSLPSQEAPEEVWDHISRIFACDDYDDSSEPFAVRFERWKLLSRLRSGGDYPIDFKHVWLKEGEVVAFKVGPNILGFVEPLDRGVVAKAFPGEGVLW